MNASLKRIAKEHVPYVLTALVVTGPWLVQPGYLFFVDMAWGQQVPLDWTDSWFLFYGLVRLLSSVMPLAIIQKIWLTVVVLVLLLGGKKIATYFLSSAWLIYVCSLFTLFNPFVYDRFAYGQMGVVAGLGFFCLGFGFLLSYLKQATWQSCVGAGCAWGMSLQFLPHIGLIGIPLGVWCLWIIIRRYGFALWRHALLFFFIIFLLDAQWLSAFVAGGGSIRTVVFDQVRTEDFRLFQLQGETTGAMLKDHLLLSGFWARETGRYQDLGALAGWGRSFWFTFFVIVIGIIAGVRSSAERRKTVALLGIGAGALMMSMGRQMPGAEGITSWLFDHAPLYRGLRETHKWLLAVIPVYLFFFALGLRTIFARPFFRDRVRMTSAALVIIVVMQAPLLLWGLAGQVQAAPYPSDWYEIDKYLRAAGCRGETIFFPWHAYMSFAFVGRIVTNPADVFFTCPVLRSDDPEIRGAYEGREDEKRRSVQAWAASRGETDVSGTVSIEYIILAKEIDWQDYLWLDERNDFVIVADLPALRLYRRSRSIYD